ncbi:hypothetical protein, partial [Sphingosinicella sp. CPCC 101087]|uniref:hypothetical protein n=1 Tax=Sphingosinicella sp. CPCC 101087 TaxID=2497754 RepID=UPI0019821296
DRVYRLFQQNNKKWNNNSSLHEERITPLTGTTNNIPYLEKKSIGYMSSEVAEYFLLSLYSLSL